MSARRVSGWLRLVLAGSRVGGLASVGLVALCCAPNSAASTAPEATVMPPKKTSPGSFEDDLAFLRRHSEVVVLRDAAGMAQVVVAPAYQGRVMTSTASGESGKSFGWVHRPVIEKGQREPHMTVLGGEDRFWLGPEGGQFGLYFAPGAPFDFEHWQVPEPLDWGAFEVTEKDATRISMRSHMDLQNRLGTRFAIDVTRSVALLQRADIGEALGVKLPASSQVVAYESQNAITNVGATAWDAQTGLVSIWILGMFQPSPHATVVVPVREGDPRALGPQVKDDYFGAVPAQRLVRQSGHVFFRADGQRRGKIGVPRARALPVAGSYDPDGGVLTVVQFALPDTPREFVDSRWAEQAEPYAGDVMNSYNDGPPAPGQAPLGPFYEIESSSPAAALAPGGTLTHWHRTVHLLGDEAVLDAVARAQLGVGLEAIVSALPAEAAP